jgi:hypothetical protein
VRAHYLEIHSGNSPVDVPPELQTGGGKLLEYKRPDTPQ